jgi:ferritin-like protein
MTFTTFGWNNSSGFLGFLSSNTKSACHFEPKAVKTETADPTECVMISPLKRFSMPSSNSNVNVILSYILALGQSIIRTYGDFLHRIRNKDDLTYYVLCEMLEDEIRRESEIESVLAVNDGK